jgi:hypothetical protein
MLLQEEVMMTTIASLIAAFVLIIGAVISELLSWTDRLEKHPRLKKFSEAKALRAVLFFVSIGLLAVVLRDVNGIREALNAPPPRQRPPAQVNLKDLAREATIQSPKAAATARPNNGGISSRAIAGHDNPLVGSIYQQGRNNVAQNGNNNTTTINDIPPERRIKPEDSASVMPMLEASRARVNVRAPSGDNEAQQLGLDIYGTLKAAGWTMENQIVLSFISVGGPVDPGITLFIHGEPVTGIKEVQLPNGHPLLSLKALFEKAGLKFVAVPQLTTPENLIDIQVGPAPKESSSR